MKITHVIATLGPEAGGPVNALLGLARAQARLGLDVEVIADQCPKGSTIAAELVEAGVQITQVDPRNLAPLVGWGFSLQRLAKRIRASDILHIHGMWNTGPTLASAIASRSGVPYVIRPCGMLDGWSLTQSRWRKRIHLGLVSRSCLNRAALIHATTSQEADEIQSLNLRAPRIVVPNGVDDLAFSPTPQALPPALEELTRGKNLLLYLGRVHPKKGLDVLIEALGRASLPDTVLLVVGPREPEYYQRICEQLKQLDLEQRVHFIDPMYGPERFALYASANLFILPSQQENFGIAVAEAMASGTAVIVSPEVALSSDVSAANAGAVVERDPAKLAEAITRLLKDPDLRKRMGNAGREHAQTSFRWTSIAEQWRKTYASTLSSVHH